MVESLKARNGESLAKNVAKLNPEKEI